MRKRNWLFALMALMACGLIAAGCGDDDDDGGDTTATTTAEETTADDTAEETTSEDTEATGSTPDDVYNACVEALEGAGAEEFAQTGCEGARDVFEQCIAQAEEITDEATKEQVLADCQTAADETVEGLESSTP